MTTISQRLLAEIQQASTPESFSFNALALDLFSSQIQTHDSYRRYAQALRGSDLGKITDWKQIPPVPADVFKLPVNTPSEPGFVFETSGTTGDIRGRHCLSSLEVYRTSVLSGWQYANLPSSNRWFLSQSPAQQPHSSLAHMFGFLNDEEDDKNRWLIDQKGRFLHAAINSLPQLRHPICLAGTALAFLRLMESSPRIPLPAGSVLLETGGYKGISLQLDKADFYERLCAFWEIPLEQIKNEYGMTELSSQAYSQGIDQPHRTPPWMKVQVIDPDTQAALPPGQTGHLELYDLANTESFLAIQTQDLATAVDEHQFHLIGRDPASLPRGCSRAADSLLGTVAK